MKAHINIISDIEYTITVQTGSVSLAGTDANVYLTLYGDKNNVARQQLKKSTQNSDPFEKGHKDEFVFENIDIGQVRLFDFERYFKLNYFMYSS